MILQKSFHNIYKNYPDLSFNRLLTLCRSQNKRFKLNINKMILKTHIFRCVKEKIKFKKTNIFLKC